MQYAMVFPGQGSQFCGMLADCFEHMPQVATVFEEASDVLGYDMKALVLTGPESQLNQTEFTQPALLTAGYALWQQWQTVSAAAPQYLAGHSLGEYTALVCGGAISFAEGLRLVQKRGQLMQQAVPAGTGAMAAVLGLSELEIAQICEQVSEGEIVSPANFNAIGQTVIAGTAAAVERAAVALKTQGAKKVLPLPVSVPSHCALMDSIRPAFSEAIAQCTWTLPTIPVLHNATVAAADSVSALQTALIDQLSQPVRWVESIQWLAAQGITHCLECGPNKVLQGLIKRVDATLQTLPLQTIAEMQQAAELCGVSPK